MRSRVRSRITSTATLVYDSLRFLLPVDIIGLSIPVPNPSIGSSIKAARAAADRKLSPAAIAVDHTCDYFLINPTVVP